MENTTEKQPEGCTIEHFYKVMQSLVDEKDKEHNLRYITSRSTEDIEFHIDSLCRDIKGLCGSLCIPTEGVFLRKTDLCIKAFKYLLCNTNFTCRSLLSKDDTYGQWVDFQQPFSTYLLIEILWHLRFEDILAEAFLHLPLDLCVEILEVLPRCINLLDFERSSKFLTTAVPNVYKKLIILGNTGSQTKDITSKARRLAANLQELLLQFSNERFLRFEDIKKTDDKYKRYGTLLKSIIQMVRMCLATNSTVEIPFEMEKMYKLTFGEEPFQTVDETVLKELLTEINRELINVLLQKVKEIDCNIYLNWTEYDDEENTSLTLQRAVGLECYFFIQNTQEYKNSTIKEYDHLVECLQQISSKPDPENSVESLQMVDLCQGVREGRLECLMALFRRYKEWDNSAIDSVDSSISLLNKTSCEELFEYLAGELNHPGKDTEKLQLYTLCLAKALVYLKITELYEITVKFIMRFSEEDNLDNVIDITNFERFIMLNPNFSSAKNLRVVLFFLCLKTRITLKILLKMTIGHTDYPDVAIILDDLMLLLPVLKIQTHSKYETMVHNLRSKCSEKRESSITIALQKCSEYRGHSIFEQETKAQKPQTVTLAVRILQDICLEGPGWNASKFSGLLQSFYTFCKVSEIVNEVFIPFLFSDACSFIYLKYTLLELQKLVGRFEKGEISRDLILAFRFQGQKLLTSNHISRYIIDELLTMISNLSDHLLSAPEHIMGYLEFLELYEFDDLMCEIFMQLPGNSFSISIGRYTNLHQAMLASDVTRYPIHVADDNVLRHMLLNCTKKQYLTYARELIRLPSRSTLGSKSELEIFENLIRLTLETCLLCLEYPEIAAPDSIGFLLRCLLQLLSTVHYKEKGKSYKRICASLQSNVMIFKDTIEYTILGNAYLEMLKQFKGIALNLSLMIDALEQFALVCMQESDKLRIYEAPHSSLAIKLWMGYDIVRLLFEKNVKEEEYLLKLRDYVEKYKGEVTDEI
ncbi:uncharacterized protein LOC100679965 [Nasonia vitripennis]|uniref:Uncharacterized protein n=1 Tax=Nasonia vitripennis TaxID=7425 RepID=A0A7M7GF97_NASVI|nr:uncharacterized protein LOC100679965 [Nasonia vitripennis]XP_008214785.1 uncharacterized protein LOC100679965 [Nasonia vitripennis]XP_008214786.1 uncharacterized protein LOC100679965 [Nasonia vitripennis]